MIRLRFVEVLPRPAHRDERELYGVEGELVTDCRYLNAAGALAAIDSEAGVAAHRKDVDAQRWHAADTMAWSSRSSSSWSPASTAPPSTS